MKIFKLPDLGEGLQEAEIVEWYVAAGDNILVDDKLIAVETDKAIVDVPSPQSGTIAKLFGAVGDIIEVGKPLVEYAAGEDEPEREDAGTVVGEMEVGEQCVEEKAAAVSHKAKGVKAVPATRALARRLDVDLSVVTPSGPDGLITRTDVERVARILADVGPLELLRGPRRAMAANMAQSNAEVAAATIVDDVDIHQWPGEVDVTVRLVRAIAAGCNAEPGLNVWYDGHANGRRKLEKVDVAIAVDTPEGLFVPVLRDVANRTAAELREGLENMKTAVRARSIPPEEMRGYSITLTNFGTMAGRYAIPVVVPPTVAILGAGAIREQVVAWQGQPAVHKVMPLSLTFDHRAVTGGEASRFLAAAIRDLELPD